MVDKKLAERNIPGMKRHERFVEAEHAQNAGKTLRRIARYFAHEKPMIFFMLAGVIFGTLCGI